MPGYAAGRVAIAICGRCSEKYPYQKLRADGNNPGLRVCGDCWDPLDPYRLPPRQIENISLQWPRPDLPLNPPLYLLDESGQIVYDENGEPILL